MADWWPWICLWALLLAAAQTTAGYAPRASLKFHQPVRPIRVALAIDENSMRDIHILINSVLTVAHDKSDLVFHILVCAKDELTARRLKSDVEAKLDRCFQGAQFEIKAFHLPPDMGFGAQLSALKKKASHWNSPSGADMARFFLAREFPHAERLLYLDNDIIVSCCLEEIFDSPLDNQAVGVALDDLNWAVMTQFQRHCNASHPLVIENMLRNRTTAFQREHRDQPVDKRDFAKSVPRYPNDGVLLIDVARYNSLSILEAMDRIAQANANGEYVVGLGTQQFTVLALHDRWKEITPRANLRHFPDMARGYMMWFYYNGILHYAGAAKPRTLCHVDSFKDNNWHRVQSFTPWLISHYQVHQMCGHPASCSRHLLHARNVFAFIKALFLLVEHTAADRELLYLRMGGGLAALDDRTYEADLESVLKAVAHLPADLPINVNSTQLNCSLMSFLQLPSFSLAGLVDRIVLHSTHWDVRVMVDSKDAEPAFRGASSLLQRFNLTYPPLATGASQSAASKLTGRREKKMQAASQSKKKQRRVAVVARDWCRNYENHTVYLPTEMLREVSSTGVPCQSVLLEIKSVGYRHWEPAVLTVDYEGNTETIAILEALDLVFIRPKAIVVVLRRESSREALQAAIVEVTHFLTRTGFMVGSSIELGCFDEGRAFDEISLVSVWGVRMNFLEFN